jgi:hypothetical protein
MTPQTVERDSIPDEARMGSSSRKSLLAERQEVFSFFFDNLLAVHDVVFEVGGPERAPPLVDGA